MREGTKALSTRVPDLLGRTGTEYDVESMPCFQAAPFPACPALQIAWPRVGGGRAACFGPPPREGITPVCLGFLTRVFRLQGDVLSSPPVLCLHNYGLCLETLLPHH